MQHHRLQNLFESIALFLEGHKKSATVCVLALTLFFMAGASRVKIDMDMESFFLETDPVKVTYNHFRQLFGSDEYIFLVYRAKDGDVFSAASLEALRTLHTEIEIAAADARGDSQNPMSHVIDVDSLLNIGYLEAEGDTLRSRKFLADAWPKDAAARAELKAEALSHPTYVPSYLNESADFSAIAIKTDLGAQRESADVEALDEILDDAQFGEGPETGAEEKKTTAEPFRKTELWEFQQTTDAVMKLYKGSDAARHFEFYPVGNPVVMKFFNDVFTTEISRLSAISLGLILVMLSVMFKSLRSVVSAVFIVVAALIWTMGIVGWLGIPMTMMVQVIVFLVLCVGVADAVHILSGYMYLVHEGRDHINAMKHVFRTSGWACFLTSFTTVVGLSSLVVIPIMPLKIFGLTASLGVFLAFVFTIVVLPVVISPNMFRKSAEKRKRKARQGVPPRSSIQYWMRRLEPLVYRWPLAVSMVFVAVAVFFAYGISMMRVDTNMVQIIHPENDVRKGIEMAEKHMGGTQYMEILVDTGAVDGLKDPEVLKAMERLQGELEDEYGHFIVSTYSLADAVKESFRALNEDRPEMYQIPNTRPMLAQTLLLFEGAAPEDREDLVTDDYMQARVSVRMRNKGSNEYTGFHHRITDRMDAIFSDLKKAYPDLNVAMTGSFALTMNLAELVSWSQIKSFSLALAVISLMFIFIFRSVKGGLISVVPNLFPILVAFGTMGFMDYALDLDTLLVAPIAIGIAVDDTVHFLSRYRIEILRHGDMVEAIRETYREVGQAMIFTSMILSVGFLIFILSQHNGMAHFGLISAAAIFSALIADLFFLPRLCMLLKLSFRK